MLILIDGILMLIDEDDKFNKIYRRYGRLMLYKANEILHDYALSEDAVSEAFIRIYKNLHKLDDAIPSNRTASFVVTVVRNVALTMIKKQKSTDYIELDDNIQDSVMLEESVISEISSENILKIIDSLGDELKSVFIMYYSYNMSHQEISKALGITANTAAVRLHRAKKRLAEILPGKEGV